MTTIVILLMLWERLIQPKPCLRLKSDTTGHVGGICMGGGPVSRAASSVGGATQKTYVFRTTSTTNGLGNHHHKITEVQPTIIKET